MAALITKLAPNEVFIFGSNFSGFHCAGAAGYACRGTSSNTWRSDPWVTKALQTPIGSPERVGKWAELGKARGWMRGHEGMSYAIQTIERPGQKRSTPLGEIKKQLIELVVFCRLHDEWSFLFTEIGTAYAGWTPQEMKDTLFSALEIAGGCPHNLVIPSDLYAG